MVFLGILLLLDSANPSALLRSGTSTPSDMGGAGEPIRWAMEQGGLEWTDKRVTREEFGALKPSEFLVRCGCSLRILGFACAGSVSVCRLQSGAFTFRQGS